ncbi:MAG: peptidylprolyl isomerase [Microcystaceae cyanobacterium]
MSIILKIGDREIQDQDLYPLLAKYRLLPQLAKELIIEEAIAEIDCSPEEMASTRKQLYQQLQITNEAQLQVWLEQNGMTSEHLDQLAVRELKIEKFKEEKWKDQLNNYFHQCKKQLDKVVYSLIRTKDAGIAQELYFRIQEGEADFSILAREYSEGAEAQTGGLVGPVELKVPHPQIGQMLFNSKPGQLSPPTRIGEWWIVIRLEKYISAQLDDINRKRLLNDLFQGWLMAQIQQKVTFSSSLK